MGKFMSSDAFPLPALTPLVQLNVQDNLRINAERWQLAHQYHQQRQNVHYQALWQPGIVYGLGVKLIAPPAGTAANFQAKSWIEIQPGFAIDGEGNPIVVGVEQDRTYPIAVPPSTGHIQTLYVVIRHVDPRQLELPTSTDRLQEQFRFDQRVNQLDSKDIELCRIRLSSDQESLTMPQQGRHPMLGELDLNYRRFAQLRSQRFLSLGLLSQNPQFYRAFNLLLRGMQVLYGDLQCQLQTIKTADPGLDALCLDGNSLIKWQQSNDPQQVQLFQSIKDYPGGLIVVADTFDQSLQTALKRLHRTINPTAVVPPHPITQQPFLFGQLPTLLTQEKLWIDDRIIVLPSAILNAWEGKSYARQEVRTWHELGINLLHYVWYNSHLRKLLR